MTVVAVPAEPPRPGLAPSELVETSPLPEAEAADLYTATFKNACIAIEQSGGDLLVNYRAGDELPGEFVGDHDSEAEIRSVVADVLGGTDNTRFEPQVGSTSSAHAGSIISHPFNEEEEAHSAAVARPIAPLLGRMYLDNAAMKPRSTPVVFGPSTEGRIYLLGFLDPIDSTDTYVELEVETLAHRADDVGHGLDYVPILPVLETGAGLVTVAPVLRPRVGSERLVPEHAAASVFEEGLRVESTDGVSEFVYD